MLKLPVPALIGIVLVISYVRCDISLTHRRILKEDVDGVVYELFWGYDNDNITFEVQARTTGYIGLGFSPNGGMANSDIVMGWVKDGTAYLQDRFATGNSAPAVDENQDVTLLSGSENATHTTLRFTRKIANANCDSKDRRITGGTSRLIWSYSNTDPASEDATPSYHGANQRGSISIHLLSPVSAQTPPQLPGDTFTLDLLNNNVSVPTDDTTYFCRGFKMPKYNNKHHVIKVEPIVQAGHETLVHHILIYACWHSVNATAHHHKEWVCYTANMPPELNDCNAVIVSWAIGGEAYYYPSNVGFPIGQDIDPDYVIMETHYDNPAGRSDFVDSSGIRLYITPTTRQYDASIMELGYSVSPLHLVPPHYTSLVSRGVCAKQCLTEALDPSGVNVFGAMLHTHLLGTQIKVRHIRNGVELPWLAYDDSYDFNYQDVMPLETPVSVLPGDEMLVDCTYKTKDQSKMTFGGLSTKNEMCLSFILYYPRQNLTKCLSTLTPTDFAPVVGDSFVSDFWYNQVQAVDFSSEAKRNSFQQIEFTSNKVAVCSHGHVKYPVEGSSVSPVTVTTEYSDNADVCATQSPTGSPGNGAGGSAGSLRNMVELVAILASLVALMSL